MELVLDNKVLEFVSDFKKPETISKVRKQALDALTGMDFPTTRVEEWKYTRVAKYVKRKYKQTQASTNIEEYAIADLNAHQLVFVNGYYDESLSTILDDDAVSVQKIDELDEEYYSDLVDGTEENVFSLINKAYQTGGVFIQIKKNKKANHPIHMIHVLEGEEVIANARHFVLAENGSKSEVIATFHSKNSANSFTNVVLEGHVESNASLTINKLQTEAKDVLHISNELFVQDESSNFLINTITTGAQLTRNGLDVIVEGENCHTEMNGAYLGTENQHMDNHTLIDQLYSNCTSSESYKGVMDGKSVGVFNGKVIVRQDAQKIAAYQSNKNILLSKTASVNSKPELEIYADDVRCSHGSTIGELDQEAIYYLRSRGISAASAKQLLVAGFIGDILDKVENEALRADIDELFLNDFGWKF
ncbi:Fe-S cluster assembly protein SufD [Brumimicrobium oceani]|uniref:Fe-S cluster assembly protein SufD n=1 Tax=Brumimicrobium oceani TaxID=2100725 RepID=A0A2U2XDT6_9FLAO|nr:Fe-S cluster assembly protein SufD [Brumimicrobium oceani]PWH85944.1 Fe-S cluster assembly protein SufD [Brumimicrobium oceani]PWH85968.1 Fe-S cluster assembly protein SufD [Brumimicrobium oceani]